MTTKKIISLTMITILGFAAVYFLAFKTDLMGMLYYNGWNSMGSGYYHGRMMTGGIMYFIFWLILLFFSISIFSSKKESYAHASDSAIEILRKQYVNGKISKAEYSEKTKYLNQQ